MCGSANRSLSHTEPVSGRSKRKLENGEQRLAPENTRSKTKSLEIADQRLGHTEILANLLNRLRSNFLNFSERALKHQVNDLDFDSAIPRFESWRPSQESTR